MNPQNKPLPKKPASEEHSKPRVDPEKKSTDRQYTPSEKQQGDYGGEHFDLKEPSPKTDRNQH